MKVTFKKQPRMTGLAAVGSPRQSVDCKIGGKVFGRINAPTWRTKDGKWSVSICIEGVGTTSWRWVTLVVRFEEENEAREWVKNYINNIITKYTIHFLED